MSFTVIVYREYMRESNRIYPTDRFLDIETCVDLIQEYGYYQPSASINTTNWFVSIFSARSCCRSIVGTGVLSKLVSVFLRLLVRVTHR